MRAGAALGFNVGAAKEFLGAPLTVTLPAAGRHDRDRIRDVSRPPQPCSGSRPSRPPARKLPFLFTQGQAILTRIVGSDPGQPGHPADLRRDHPCPGWHARGHERRTRGSRRADKDALGRAVFRFRMDKPIPPYLIALAVGDIAFRPIGKNTGVYAEPSVVDRAANEFAEVDQMIAAAEKLYGPYRWGRYDILVLPPSFPFGGMENPRSRSRRRPSSRATDRSSASSRTSLRTHGPAISSPMRPGTTSG